MQFYKDLLRNTSVDKIADEEAIKRAAAYLQQKIIRKRQNADNTDVLRTKEFLDYCYEANLEKIIE